LCGIELRVSFYGRNGENTNFIVVRESECLGAAGHIDRIRKKVGVTIRLVEPIGGVLVGGIPCKARRLYISWLEANIVFRISWGDGALLPLL
jgi:hypothetical protein